MIRIGIFGFGGVGQALLNIIRSEKLNIKVEFIVDRSFQKKKKLIREIPASDDPYFFKKFEPIDAIVELIGGTSTALFVVREALDASTTIITANKALLAEHGYSIFTKAKERKTAIGFEASVAGAIPIIKTIRNIFAYEKIETLQGILNGTTNYILSKMKSKKKDQESMIKRAQELGIAEADPHLDLSGTDSTQKLALLCVLLNNKWVDYHNIYTKGIEQISLKDVLFAQRMGYDIRLLATFKKINGDIYLWTEPTLIDHEHYLWGIEEENNAIFLKGKYSKSHLLVGKGAGPFPTAYSVLSDIFYTIEKKDQVRIESEHMKPAYLDNLKYPMYIRFSVRDETGVLAKIAKVLGDHQISIARVIQESDFQKPGNDNVDLFILTHECHRKSFMKAVEILQNEAYIQDTINYISMDIKNKTSTIT